MLDALGLSPFIDCNMSLGAGSGAVAVIPLLDEVDEGALAPVLAWLEGS